VQLAVCPASTQVSVGTGTQNYAASVANTSDSVVSWQVNGVPGGNATVGTITSNGVFTAPATLPSNASETITAVADADATITATSAVTLAVPGAPTTTVTASRGGGGALGFGELLLLAAIAVSALCGRAGVRIGRA
jgi:hypothetical protein